MDPTSRPMTGTELRAWRRQLGVTLPALARSCGLSKSFLSLAEREEIPLRPKPHACLVATLRALEADRARP